jgi:hypothetical protein
MIRVLALCDVCKSILEKSNLLCAIEGRDLMIGAFTELKGYASR